MSPSYNLRYLHRQIHQLAMKISNRLDTIILCWNDDDSAQDTHESNLSNPDLSKDPELALLLSMYLHGIDLKYSRANRQTPEMAINSRSISDEQLLPPSKFARRLRNVQSKASNALLGSERPDHP